MKKSNLLSIGIIVALFFQVNLSNAQDELYFENFPESGKEAVGVTGECTGTDIATCPTNVPDPESNWSLDGNFIGLDAAGDLVQTDGSSLVARDLDAEVCFVSTTFDISGHTDILLTTMIAEDSDMEVADYVDVKYIVDGVSTTIINFDGLGSPTHTYTGDVPDDEDFMSSTLTQMIPDGNMLEIQICMFNGANTEAWLINEVKVEGEVKTVVDPIPTMGQWGLFILALLFSSIGLVFIGRRQFVKV